MTAGPSPSLESPGEPSPEGEPDGEPSPEDDGGRGPLLDEPSPDGEPDGEPSPEDDGGKEPLLDEPSGLEDDADGEEEGLPSEERLLEDKEEEELGNVGQQSTSFSYWNQYSIFGSGSVPKRTSFIRTIAPMPTGRSRQHSCPLPLPDAPVSPSPSQHCWVISSQHRLRWSMSTPFPSSPTPSLGSSTEL